MYEIGLRPVTEVGDLRSALDIDAGQLSRLLARMDEKGIVTRERSEGYGRRQRVRMTPAGLAERAVLVDRSVAENQRLLDQLDDEDQERLLGAMRTIRDLLGDAAEPPSVVLRRAEPGDLGWIVSRHGTLYVEEFGWIRAWRDSSRASSPTSRTRTTRPARRHGSPRRAGARRVDHVRGSRRGRRSAAPAPGRAERAGIGNRLAAGRRVPRFRTRGRLRRDDPVDELGPQRRATYLRASRVRAGRRAERTSAPIFFSSAPVSRFRGGSRRLGLSDLGSPAVATFPGQTMTTSRPSISAKSWSRVISGRRWAAAVAAMRASAVASSSAPVRRLGAVSALVPGAEQHQSGLPRPVKRRRL